ncbi:hypothetical protein [Actinokineospora diospyrosa]|uniref:Tetratricopeptide repeat protein n=1 Tax=Actinokineospora diospyrosa TaxID=103728 RepID=A0ABT1IJB8_9PSEU|nr:hypothetical protein [Actinokineospora diospyrosa]MCP2272743.1 hypothetical protein [Actinokineospora diospyrosa]
MAYEQRDAARVLAFAQAAYSGPWQLPPAVRAEVAQQEARGLAMLGEPIDAVERKLGEARTLAAAPDTTDGHHRLSSYYNDQTHLLRVASCYIEAGKPARAATLFGEVLTTQTLSRRDEGYFRARRAVALALSGDPDTAALEGVAAVELASELGSSRTKRELGRVVATLQPWRNRPAPRALQDALRT